MIKKNQIVYLRSKNDLLKPYWKDKTEFEVDSISGEVDDEVRFATLRFVENGELLSKVVFESELVPLNKLMV